MAQKFGARWFESMASISDLMRHVGSNGLAFVQIAQAVKILTLVLEDLTRHYIETRSDLSTFKRDFERFAISLDPEHIAAAFQEIVEKNLLTSIREALSRPDMLDFLREQLHLSKKENGSAPN